MKIKKIISFILAIVLMVLIVSLIINIKNKLISTNAIIFKLSKINYLKLFLFYLVIEFMFLLILLSIIYLTESPVIIDRYSTKMHLFIKWYLICSNVFSMILGMIFFLNEREFTILTMVISFVAIFSNLINKPLHDFYVEYRNKKK